MTSDRHRVRLAAGALAVAALVVAPLPASASHVVIDDGAPGLLTLHVLPAVFAPQLDPGDRAWWSVVARLDAPEESPLTLTIMRTGTIAEHEDGLLLELRECSIAWELPVGALDAPVCAGSETTLLAARPLAAVDETETADLGPLEPGADRHLMLFVALPPIVPRILQGGAGEIDLGFFVAGDAEHAGPPRPAELSATGLLVMVPLALAVLLVVLGAVARGMRRRTAGGG